MKTDQMKLIIMTDMCQPKAKDVCTFLHDQHKDVNLQPATNSLDTNVMHSEIQTNRSTIVEGHSDSTPARETWWVAALATFRISKYVNLFRIWKIKQIQRKCFLTHNSRLYVFF